MSTARCLAAPYDATARVWRLQAPFLLEFGPRNYFRLFANDVLHQCYNGMCKHILDCLKSLLEGSTNAYDNFNERLRILRSCHNAVIPSAGYATMKMLAVVCSTT